MTISFGEVTRLKGTHAKLAASEMSGKDRIGCRGSGLTSHAAVKNSRDCSERGESERG